MFCSAPPPKDAQPSDEQRSDLSKLHVINHHTVKHALSRHCPVCNADRFVLFIAMTDEPNGDGVACPAHMLPASRPHSSTSALARSCSPPSSSPFAPSSP